MFTRPLQATRSLAAMTLAAMLCGVGADADAATPAQWQPESIAWQQVNADGTRYALLEGRREGDGLPFSYAFFIPAGTWDQAHWHSADARVFVARGTLRLGYGDTLDRSRAIAYPAGSYLLVPAGAHHFDGADEDTLIFGTALGPWATHYVSALAAPSAGTASAPPATLPPR
jgi:quercetin dioxygenase-like cupin family protein